MAQQLSEERRRQEWAKITAQAWEDNSFKQQLIKNPTEVLRSHGMAFPEGYNVRIVEQGSAEAAGIGQYTLTEKDDRTYDVVMRLPNKPSEVSQGELNDQELESVAGGGNPCCCCSCCPCCTCT